MAEQMRPASPQQAPDPSTNYERSHPGREAGMGRMGNNKAVPERSLDQSDQAAGSRQDPTRQVNAQDTVNQRGGPPAVQPDHSTKDEEPFGWDRAPTDIHDPERQRQPRTEGRGGTP